MHAQHHIRLIKRVLGNQATRRLVRRIRHEGAAARARLDGDVVTGSTELAHQVGDHGDTRLPESLLSGYRDAHITKPNALISHLLAQRALNPPPSSSLAVKAPLRSLFRAAAFDFRTLAAVSGL